MPAKKQHLTVLDPATFRSLEAFVSKRGQPKSLVAEAAIASFLTPDDSVSANLTPLLLCHALANPGSLGYHPDGKLRVVICPLSEAHSGYAR